MTIEMQPIRQILGLDLIRFSAACLVMALHLGFWSWWPVGAPGTIRRTFPDLPAFNEITDYTWFGWVGVQIFFVLSGFVIAYSASTATVGSFVRSRAVRIYPAVWICSSITLVVLLAAGVPWLPTFLLWGNTIFLSPYPSWVDGVYWTLIVELVFYAAVASLLLAQRFQLIGWMMGVIGLASSAFAAAAVFTPLPHSVITQYLLIEHGCHFAIGTFLWLVLTQNALPRHWFVLILLLMGGALEVAGTATTKLELFHLTGNTLIPVVIWLLAVGLIVASVRYNDAMWAILGKYARSVRVIGLATYPLYLLHSLVGGGVMTFASDLGRWIALFLGAAAAVLLSFAVALWLEPPLQKRMKAHLNSYHRSKSGRGVVQDS